RRSVPRGDARDPERVAGSVRDGGGSELRDERVGVEALERERGDQLRRLAAARDELRERLADDRCGLEAVRPPARGDVEVLELRPAEDRAVVGRQVAEPGPRAQDTQAL